MSSDECIGITILTILLWLYVNIFLLSFNIRFRNLCTYVLVAWKISTFSLLIEYDWEPLSKCAKFCFRFHFKLLICKWMNCFLKASSNSVYASQCLVFDLITAHIGIKNANRILENHPAVQALGPKSHRNRRVWDEIIFWNYKQKSCQGTYA